MNIAFFNTVKFWGGGEKLHFEYAEKLRDLGHNVFMIAAPGSSLAEKSKKNKISTFEIKLSNLSFLNPFKYKKVIDFYKNKKIEVVVFSNSPDLKVGGISAKKSKVSKIVYLRGLAVKIKKSLLNKYLLYKVLTHIVPNSLATKNTIFHNYNKEILEHKTKVIYHGIEIEDFDNETNLMFEKQSNEIILGNAGRLVEQKGQNYLLQIAKILKEKNVDFKLYIAGDGILKQELQNQTRKLGLEKHVEFTGFIADIPKFMKSIDIFVLSSLWEGFGYAIVEANAACKPVVAFNLSSNPEIIKDKETGFLIEFPDVNGFAERIIELSNNKIIREKMGLVARNYVEKNFLLSDRIREFEKYITK